MSGLTIEPLREEDLDAFIKLQWTAFEPLEADMIMPMIYTAGLLPDIQERLRQRLLSETNGDLGKYCFVARDTTSKQAVGISWWAVKREPPKTQEEVETQWQTVLQAQNASSPTAGFNTVLAEAFQKAAIFTEFKVMRGIPYSSLRVLAVHSQYQRRGIGSLLLEHGLRKFGDDLRLPVYLTCGVAGKPLYERHGFEVVCDFPFDGREYGGRSEGRHWCMFRALPTDP
ncbi:hypothetical protein LTR62_002399 [Meristemomyces frigidus]|uniref:N-acetyltransferase domain-containing protein n=1 Tax=Meristemomyces frigidus TaxID=1508187 RepID=A0AAN7TJI9_9PEZI|nr:hypothetical protein LTR62_002399 [Meristemomyces frigidus]